MVSFEISFLLSRNGKRAASAGYLIGLKKQRIDFRTVRPERAIKMPKPEQDWGATGTGELQGIAWPASLWAETKPLPLIRHDVPDLVLVPRFAQTPLPVVFRMNRMKY